MNARFATGGGKRVAIILAGGERTRLRSLTTRINGAQTPKQFCSLLGERSLLEETHRRVTLSFPRQHVIAVLNRAHERFYRSQLADMTPPQLVIQPEGRGTGAAIVYALFRALRFGRDACVAIFPSDHYVDPEAEFMRHVDLAFSAIEARPELTVLLGIVPERAEPNYGWIEPGARISLNPAQVYGVRAFWEKPSHTTTDRLVATGALCNTFVIVARVSTLLGLLLAAKPALYTSFALIEKAIGTSAEERRIEDLYARLETIDFSSSVLARCPANLAVLKIDGVKWSDLGEPARVIEIVTRMGSRRPHWFAA